MRPTGYATPKNPTLFETLDDVLVFFGATSVEHLSRLLFKNTDCGMFAEEPNDKDHLDGVDLVVGSIVEGSDAVFVEKFRFPLLLSEWEAALQRIEVDAGIAWNESHEDDTDEDDARWIRL